jgi:hypothetical protein
MRKVPNDATIERQLCAKSRQVVELHLSSLTHSDRPCVCEVMEQLAESDSNDPINPGCLFFTQPVRTCTRLFLAAISKWPMRPDGFD